MLNIYADFFKSDLVIMTGKYLLIILPILVPLALFYTAWVKRFRWLTMKFIESQKPCLLEIRLPKEITKSPAAMEIFFTHLTPKSPSSYGDVFLAGKVRPWFSCEIVSTGGVVRFFIWCSQDKFKKQIESQLYAQYPNLEIFEAEDYTKDFYFDPENYPLTGAQFILTQPDPFPIKTYIDYGLGLNEDQKEEYKVDPITSVVEYLGSLKKGENAWIQILIQKHEVETWAHGVPKVNVDPKKANIIQKIALFFLGRSRTLKNEIKAEIEKIRKEATPEGDDDKVFKFPNPTKGQNERITALERSATKTPFDCMIRVVYIADKNSYVDSNTGGLTGCLKQYGSSNLNGFRNISVGIEDWEEDIAKIFPFLNKLHNEKINNLKRSLLYSYKLRSYFNHPFKHHWRTKPFFQLWGYDKGENKPFILTTEELATIWHFPSNMVSQTPTLERVSSKKSEAPSNLPI